MMDNNELHQLYCQAYDTALRAIKAGREYIGFVYRRDKLILTIANSNNGNRSSCRLGLGAADWAQNILFRLVECNMIPATIDDIEQYLSSLNKTGYNREK